MKKIQNNKLYLLALTIKEDASRHIIRHARNMRDGGGCGRGVSPFPHQGVFVFLEFKISDRVIV